jgi:microcystin-dependent protein
MSEPFIAEIRMVGFNFAPRGWSFCDGQILPINQNQALFSLLGTTYGGDGRTSFGLPDLRGRSPSFTGSNGGSSGRSLGQKAGVETVTLITNEMPSHGHVLKASDNSDKNTPQGNYLGKAAFPMYGDLASPSNMAAATIGDVGGGQAHDNRQPWLAISFCIALQGLFPS